MKDIVNPTPEQLGFFQEFMEETYSSDFVFDWNYMMKVVQKIESIKVKDCNDIQVHIVQKRCTTIAEDGEQFDELTFGYNKIKAVFLNTSYFIRWYLNFKKKNDN